MLVESLLVYVSLYDFVISKPTSGSRLVISAHRSISWVCRALDSLQSFFTIFDYLIFFSLGAESIEERMHQRLFGRESLLWIHFKQASHQGEPLLRDLASILLLYCFRLCHVWKFESHESWILRELFLLERSQSSQNLLDLKELIYFALTWEQRLSIGQLPHYAANCPYIYFARISIAQQELWASVPSCGNIVSHLWILLCLRDVPGKAEITELEIVSWINQEVLGLDVSVDYVHLMTVINGFEQLEDIPLHDVCLQSSCPLFKNLQQCLVNELENQIELAFSVIKM